MLSSSDMSTKTYCSCSSTRFDPGERTLGGHSSVWDVTTMATSTPRVTHRKSSGNSARRVAAIMRANGPGSAAPSTAPPAASGVASGGGEGGGDGGGEPSSTPPPFAFRAVRGGREAAALTSSSSMLPPW